MCQHAWRGVKRQIMAPARGVWTPIDRSRVRRFAAGTRGRIVANCGAAAPDLRGDTATCSVNAVGRGTSRPPAAAT